VRSGMEWWGRYGIERQVLISHVQVANGEFGQ